MGTQKKQMTPDIPPGAARGWGPGLVSEAISAAASLHKADTPRDHQLLSSLVHSGVSFSL